MIVGIVASSVLFGVLHGGLTVVLYATWAGLFFAGAAAVTGRIGAPIIAHARNNTILLLVHTAPD